MQDFWSPTLTDLYWFSPELALVGTLVALLIVPLIAGRSAQRAGVIVLCGTVLALLLTLRVAGDVRDEAVSGLAPQAAAGMLVLDNLTVYFKVILLLFMTGVTGLWFIGSQARERNAEEFFVLLVGSALGMILMTSTAHLLMVALAIEMASLPSYAIVGFNKRNRLAAEASLKYVIFGGVSAAIMLYGISLLYAFYHSLNFGDIAQQLVMQLQLGRNSLVIGIALFCLMGGIAFKVAAVPFHFWCPDAFQGAQIEVTTWLSVASKAAALVLLLRLVDLLSTAAGGQPVAVHARTLNGIAWGLGIMAAVTCTWGNFAAYKQTNVKRLLAYSSIAHAGYMMMAAAIFTHPATAGSHAPIAAILVYLLIYALMNLGAFGVAAMVVWQTGSEELDAFSGLGRRAPWLAVPMVFCLVSLVGLPPFGGFIGKLWILLALGEHGGTLCWSLVVVAVVNTLISLFFYFRIVKAMFLTDDGQPGWSPPIPGTAMVNACGVALILLGVLFIRQPRDIAARYAQDLFTREAGRVAAARTVDDDDRNAGAPASTAHAGQEQQLAGVPAASVTNH